MCHLYSSGLVEVFATGIKIPRSPVNQDLQKEMIKQSRTVLLIRGQRQEFQSEEDCVTARTCCVQKAQMHCTKVQNVETLRVECYMQNAQTLCSK